MVIMFSQTSKIRVNLYFQSVKKKMRKKVNFSSSSKNPSLSLFSSPKFPIMSNHTCKINWSMYKTPLFMI